MFNEELLAYIKECRAAGNSFDDIQKILKTQGGWDDKDIKEAFSQVTKKSDENELSQEKSFGTTDESPQNVENPQKDQTLEKDTLEKGIETESEKEDDGSKTILEQAKEQNVDKKSNPIFFIVLVVVILGILGGIAYGYFTFFNSKKALTPHEVITAMIENYAAITSVKEEGSFVFSGSAQVPSDMFGPSDGVTPEMAEVEATYGFDYIIRSDSSDPDNVKGDGEVNMDVNASYSFMSFDFNISIAVRLIDNILYVRVKEMTPLPIPVNLTSLEGQWYAIDFQKLMEEAGVDMEEVMSQRDLQKDEAVRILQNFIDNPEVVDFINRTFVLTKDKEEVVDMPSYHYNISLTRDDWEFFIKKIFVVVVDYMAQQDLLEGISIDMQDLQNEFSAEDLDEMFTTEEWGIAASILEELSVDIWIDKEEFLPKKTSVALEVNDMDIEGSIISFVLSSDGTFSDYNKAFEIEVPEGYKTLEELEETLFGETRKKGNDASIKANMSYARAQAELYYDDNNNSYGVFAEVSGESCYESGTFFTNAGMVQILDDIYDANTSGPTVCGVGENGQSYVFSTKLNNGSWYCIDSSGIVSETNIELEEGDTSCPEPVNVYDSLIITVPKQGDSLLTT